MYPLHGGKRLDDETIFDPTGSDVLPEARVAIKSEVGGRAITDLTRWFEKQWADSTDFKDALVELLDASKFVAGSGLAGGSGVCGRC